MKFISLSYLLNLLEVDKIFNLYIKSYNVISFEVRVYRRFFVSSFFTIRMCLGNSHPLFVDGKRLSIILRSC